MDRYQPLADQVFLEYSQLYHTSMRIMAISHTTSVIQWITALAISRHHSVELARIAALFHDYASYTQNCGHEQHAKFSSLLAVQFLEKTGQFKQYEIDNIAFAIRVHSKKDQEDSPFCELLKDADLLASYMEDPDQPLTPSQSRRLLHALQSLQ